MKKVFLFIFLLCMSLFLNAQQIGMFNHHYYKPMIYNPAFTGSGDATNIFLATRSQWVGFKNAPQSNLALIDGSLMNKKIGLGFGVLTDRKGLSNRIGANLNYAYRLNINDNAHLRFGISIGVIDHSIDYSKATVEDASDPTLFQNVQRKAVFDGNAGLALIWKGLEFGASVPQIIGNKIGYIENTKTRSYYTQERHYMGMFKYKIVISRDKGLSITPLALVRYLPNAPLQYDGNLNFDWNDKLWLGAMYKSDYGISANIGIRIHKQLYIGYSYDIITGSIGTHSGMAHELMLNFKFGNKEKQTPDAVTKVDIANLESKYQNRIDSLTEKEQQNQEKINELTKKLEEQKQQQEQYQKQQEQYQQLQQQTIETENVNPGDNQNKAAIANSANRTVQSGVWIITNPTTAFKDVQYQEAQKAFYVIVGTYYYRDFAEADSKRYAIKGYNSGFIFDPRKKFNYVYTHKTSSKEEAIQKAKQWQASGIPDAWVQELVK